MSEGIEKLALIADLPGMEAQRAELEARIAAAKAATQEVAIARVKALMAEEGVTLEMLGGRKARVPRAAAVAAQKQSRSTKGVKIAPKYRDAHGNTWSGRGLQPLWVRDALRRGDTLEQFAVTAEAA